MSRTRGEALAPARPAALLAVLGILALAGAVGCGSGEVEPPPPAVPAPEPAPPARVEFTEVAAEVGLDFVHNTGAFGSKWLPETMGSGCAWVDYDGDGDPDALLLSGRDFAGHPTGGRETPALFRNDGGRFRDVTRQAGLDVPSYSLGVTCGDYDADGDPDLYVTALGPNLLFRNDGGRFAEIGAAAGVADPGFGSSASWLDHDRDGDLDLFTLNYVQWSPETDIFCSLDGSNKSYCTPEAYQGASPRLYRNDAGRFHDVTVEAGIHDPTAKSLGLVCADLDGDGWDDVFVANDTQPNYLLHNEGDGTFTEQGVVSGVAFDEAGRARGAMGVDVGDYDGSGRPSLVIGNFSNEMLALYHNEGAGFFIDAAPSSAVGQQSLLTLAFGTLFVDFDLDGRLDIFVSNGHVENDIAKVQSRVSWEQPPHLFRNVGDGKFVDVAPECEALSVPMVARGAAAADFDGDGDPDLLVNASGGRPRLFRNDGADGGQALRVELVADDGSNPDALGARVEVQAGGATRTTWVRAAHSYASQSERPLTFGLGAAETADVVVHWPGGAVSRRAGVPAGSSLRLEESAAD